jgi:hypothetical protein
LFERKIEANGTIIWDHSILANASNLYNEGRGVVVSADNVAFTGTFYRFGDFDPSPSSNLTLTCTAYAPHMYLQNLKDNTASLEAFDLNNVSIYPNPTNDVIYLNSDKEIKSIEVYSLQGERINTSKWSLLNSFVDLSNVPNGVYLVKIRTSKAETTRRIVKN